jgi:hypothetical protein
MTSVQEWTRNRSFDYEFVGDEFFSFAPEWFREKCAEHFYPVTDIARLHLMKKRMPRYERMVWIDADVIVFDADQFSIETEMGYAFSHEMMLGIRSGGQRELSGWSINNAVMVMHRGNPMLDYYIFAAEEIVRRTPLPQFSRTMIGPKFLNALSSVMPIERLTCVGLFTPEYMNILAHGTDRRLLAAYRQKFGFQMAAANLCHFVRGETPRADIERLDKTFERGIELLLESKGALVNARP